MDDLVKRNYDHVNLDFHESYDSVREFASEISHFADAVKSGGRVLNVGSTFSECNYFLSRGFNVSDIDISDNILKSIRVRSDQVDLIHGSVKDFSAGSFDGIWACRSLFHIAPEDIDATLVNLKSHLNPGGVLGVIIFTTEEHDYVEQRIADEQSIADGQPTTYYRVVYSRDVLIKKLQSAGFKVIDTRQVRDQDGDESLFVLAKG